VIEDTPPSSPLKVKGKSPAKPSLKSSPRKPEPRDGAASPPTKRQKLVPKEEESDSDMSVLIDSTPPDSKSRKKSDKSAPKPKPKKEADQSKTKDTSISTKEDEIKKLKSLVYQCGVRKNWSVFPGSRLCQD
jgi:hypothetical protein